MNKTKALQNEARRIAEESHEENFPSRRGSGPIGDFPAVYLYDNNPYSRDLVQREREHNALKAALAPLGFQVLAVASYPLAGAEAGYTVAIIFGTAAFEGTTEEAVRVLNSEWSKILSPDQPAPTHRTRTGQGLRLLKGGRDNG